MFIYPHFSSEILSIVNHVLSDFKKLKSKGT